MPTHLSGQVDLVSAIETVALASNTDVASFTDANNTDTAANFTATIDWGDGITTTGTVVGSNGSFQVQGGHTYGDDNFFSPVVTIVRTADSSTLVLNGGVNVSDTDNITGHNGATIVSSNHALSNVTVATFSDSNTVNTTGDFSVSIDWGDGTVTSGTLSGSNGQFTVTGSHTYATDGNFTITTFMNDDSPDTASGVATTQANIGFGGTETLQFAAETVAIASGTQVATFADTAGLTAADYTASIDWGDGTTTTGSVSGSNGSFTVDSTSSHTYADEGNFTETVTITRGTDNAQIAPSGTVQVQETDNIHASGTTVHGDPNTPLTNVTVATFTDSNTVNVAGDFVATIDWGDGNTTTGTISGSSGSFTVAGTHTYTQNGQDAISVQITEDPAANATANDTAASTALIGLAPVSASNLSGTEGTAIPAGVVATFSDSNLADTAGSFTATIDWGDGVTTTGTVSGSNGSFTVNGGPHTYADEGSDPVTTTLTRTSDNTAATAVGTANVADADHLSVTADNISGSPGEPFNNVQVATFTTTYAANGASDFTALIDWGDGTTTVGTVSGSNGSFAVNGSHTYTQGGTDQLKVTVAEDDFSNQATGTATATINFPGQVVLHSATEGTALAPTTAVATYSDSNLADTAGSFTATIDWGDGVTTAGTVVGAAGSFTVEGGHTFADETSAFTGNDLVTVTLNHTADGASSTVDGTVAITEGDSLTGIGTTIAPNAGQGFSGTVATFTDTDTVTAASDFVATIDWGDGTTTAGTVSGSNGVFVVNGTHTYAAAGQDTVTVTLADDSPGTATATATTTANVHAIVGVMDLTSATEGTALANSTAVATFIDANVTDMAGDFTATIDWGDGVTTNGTVVGSTGMFTVEGGHTYTDEGTDTATVTLTHTSDHSQTTTSGPVSVAEADVLTAVRHTAAIVVNHAFSGQVAEFTDSDHANVAGDFAATINWGDGTSSAGTVSGSNGDFTVSGSHNYSGKGQFTATVTLADDAPGTATATTTAKIVVNNGNHSNSDSGVDNSVVSHDGTGAPSGETVGDIPINWDLVGVGQFSGPPTDGSISTDVLLVSNAGAAVIWQSSNGIVTADQQVGQLPTNWHFAGIGDFNGDGKSDVLWQSDSGAVTMWEMNGTQVAVNQQIGQLPTNWHVSGVSDVNGDGMSDIVLTSNTGAERVWLMNGTQVVADQPFNPNGALAVHVLDTHVTDAPPAGPATIPGTLGGLVHDPHLLV